MSDFTFVLTIEIPADTLEEAYAKLHQAMVVHGYGWMTEDEVYKGDDQLTPEELQAAIEDFYRKKWEEEE